MLMEAFLDSLNNSPRFHNLIAIKTSLTVGEQEWAKNENHS